MRLGRIILNGEPTLAIEENGAAIPVLDPDLGGSWRTALSNWAHIASSLQNGQPLNQAVAEPQWLCPLIDPPKFFLLAGNFRAHVIESGFAPLPEGLLTPQYFMKPASTLIGPTDAIPLVNANVALDYEAELGVIIGKRLKRGASREEALDAVWGYTVINDISERKLNKNLESRHKRQNDDFFDWLVGKWFDGSAPLGPWLVSKEEIEDVGQLQIIARLNGDVVQSAPCSAMVHDIGDALVFLSQVVTLESGDVVSMGTPEGVGMARGRFLGDGDLIECEIPGIGKLANRVCHAD